MEYNEEDLEMYYKLIHLADNNNQEAQEIINLIDKSFEKTVSS